MVIALLGGVDAFLLLCTSDLVLCFSKIICFDWVVVVTERVWYVLEDLG